MLDVLITEFDTAFSFEPLSPSGMAWLYQNAPNSAWQRGDVVCVQLAQSYRVVNDMQNAGLEVRTRHWRDAPCSSPIGAT